jgi:hypothetical protein
LLFVVVVCLFADAVCQVSVFMSLVIDAMLQKEAAKMQPCLQRTTHSSNERSLIENLLVLLFVFRINLRI